MQMIRKRIILIGIPVILGVILLIISFSINTKKEKASLNADMVQVTSEPIQTSAGWGYNIMVGDKIYIHQQCIPAVPGNRPFVNKGDAMKTAEVVIKKIVNHKLPYVTRKELDSLNISM
jgi:hypothetical protein